MKLLVTGGAGFTRPYRYAKRCGRVGSAKFNID